MTAMLNGIGHAMVTFVCEKEGEVVEWVTRGYSMATWLRERGYEILEVVVDTATVSPGLIG